MFTVAELREVSDSPEFRGDLAMVRETLGTTRLHAQQKLFTNAARLRLAEFIECVLASSPDWPPEDRQQLCQFAAEVAEALCVAVESPRMKLRAAILYELANLPAISQSLATTNSLPIPLKAFFTRSGGFGLLSQQTPKHGNGDNEDLAALGFESDAQAAAAYLQGQLNEPPVLLASDVLSGIAKEVAIGFSATEFRALSAAFQRRIAVATRSRLDTELTEELRRTKFPAELWPTQIAAIDGGLLDSNIPSWGLAAPTGTGKTFISHLLILNTLRKQPDKKVLYLAPSRALVYEVASNLDLLLRPMAYSALAITPQLVDLDEEESSATDEASVLVLTPEKADMLLRLGLDLFNELSLVIVDEAHHLESSTRGILLEMYLWRLKILLKGATRFVFLSAVTPNIDQIARWMSPDSRSVTVQQRPTRMRAGLYRIVERDKGSEGVVEFTDGVTIRLTDAPEHGVRRQLVQLANLVGPAGPVLIVARGKGECEKLANTMVEWLQETNAVPLATSPTETLERLDSLLEREMYPDVPLRKLAKYRVAYHHAGLPPRVRIALEHAIKENLVDYVFATTTLAEGVNFPFATVIVQSLALREAPQKGRPSRYHPVTPRVFWNLAGRAGRPGFDREGQVILFQPTLGLDKINYLLKDYLNADLTASEPVESALAKSIRDISVELDTGNLKIGQLGETRISETVSRHIQGALNLLRVSLLHARASRVVNTYEEILDGTFAAEILSDSEKNLARTVFGLQSKVIDDFLSHPNAPSVELAAELGLSIETLEDLRAWAAALQDWQINNLHRTFYGGQINLDQAKYVIGPIAKHMAELEGPKLGGFLSEVILLWMSGVPFVTLRSRLSGNLRSNSIEDLISLVYSRVQFLLPWGLYAADRLVETEARQRGLEYLNELKNLAYLVDSGVSSFDAVRLVHLEFERTDAERLANAYHAEGGLRLGLDVLGWLRVKPLEFVKTIVRGPDNRRIDFDLEKRIEALRVQPEG